jgi:hypothetical protein
VPLLSPSRRRAVMSAATCVRRVQPHIDRQAAGSGEKGRQLIRAIADDGHALRLQHLARGRQVEDGLGAAADDRHRRLAQLAQVGADVEWVAAMDAADAARGEQLDARQMGHDHRPGHSGRPVLATGDSDGQVAPAALAHRSRARLLAQILDLIERQPNDEPTAQHGHGGRHSAPLADGGLHRQRGFDVLWVG